MERPEPEPILETHALPRRFGPLVAVDRLTISIEGGELFGLPEPSGAGKTVTDYEVDALRGLMLAGGTSVDGVGFDLGVLLLVMAALVAI